MALNKESKDYYYNLGRVVAIVQIMQNLNSTFASDVFNNALEKLPYHLNIALRKNKHNLHKELLEASELVRRRAEFPKSIMTAYDHAGTYYIGYYHQKSYLQSKYNGIYGNVETSIEHHTPCKIDLKESAGGAIDGAVISDNSIEDLRR